MSDINTQLLAYKQSLVDEEAARAAATAKVTAALEALKAAAGGATFTLEGQHYQIRTRNGRTYLCELVGPPKGRPKKTEEEKAAAKAAKVAAAEIPVAEAPVEVIEA